MSTNRPPARDQLQAVEAVHYALGELTSSGAGVVNVVGPEERIIGPLARSEEREQVEHGKSLAATELDEDVERPRRTEEPGAQRMAAAPLGRRVGGDLLRVGIHDEGECDAVARRHAIRRGDVSLGETPRGAELGRVLVARDGLEIVLGIPFEAENGGALGCQPEWPQEVLADTGPAKLLVCHQPVHPTLDRIEKAEDRGLPHERNEQRRLEPPVARNGNGQAVGVEPRHGGSHPIVVDVGHVEVEHDEVRLQREAQVLELEVLENRRVARDAGVQDLHGGAAPVTVERRFDALGDGRLDGKARALGERVAEHEHAEHARRLRARDLTLAQAEGIRVELHAAHPSPKIWLEPMVQERVGRHVAVLARSAEAQTDLDDGESEEQPDGDGVAEQHVGGLEADTGQRGERGAVAWDFAAVLGDQSVGHPDDGARLGAIKAGRPDLQLERGRRQPRPLGRGAVLLEQRGSHLVHPLIGALRGKNRRDQQLERVAEGQRDPRVGVGAFEESDDLPGAGFALDRCLAFHDPPTWSPAGAISIRATSTGNGRRAARPRHGSSPLIPPPTSRDGTGTPPTWTRSAASANGRSEAGTKRTRALMSGPRSSIRTSANPRSKATCVRPRSLPAARKAWKSSAVTESRSSRNRPRSRGSSRPSAIRLDALNTRSSNTSRRSWARRSATPRRRVSPSVAAVAETTTRRARPCWMASPGSTATSRPSTSRATSAARCRSAPARARARVSAAPLTTGRRRARTVAREPSGSGNSPMTGNAASR